MFLPLMKRDISKGEEQWGNNVARPVMEPFRILANIMAAILNTTEFKQLSDWYQAP